MFKRQQAEFKVTFLYLPFHNKMGNLYDDIRKAAESLFNDDVKKDNIVFRLHRSFSVILLGIFAIILGTSQVSQINT